ncbi:MAG: amidohydrolase family protein, partial [Planctomycetota bacterium]
GADAGVKRAVEEGIVFGPRVVVSVNPLCSTGGPGHERLPSGEGLERYVPLPGRPSGLCDGPEAVRKKVRQMLQAGADTIKMMVTASEFGDRGDPFPLFSDREIGAAVEEAHLRGGKKIMAHALGSEGAILASMAGVASVEHGVRLNQVTVDTFAQEGTVLVPTLLESVWRVERARESGPKAAIDRAKRVLDDHMATVDRALRSGVRIAVGANGGGRHPGSVPEEILLLTKAGMPVADALVAATRTGAELLGFGEGAGTIEEGKWANLLLIRRDPLADPSVLTSRENLLLIMKEGKTFHRAL